jgi:hypothetical protein
MRLPTDPRRRRLVAGGGLALAVLLVLLVIVITAGGDEDDPEQAIGATASPRPPITIESPSSTPAPPEDTGTAEPPGTSVPPATATVAPRPSGTTPPTSVPPTEALQVNLCAGTLQEAIDAAAPGAVLDMSACTFDGTARVDKAVTLIGGTLTSQTANRNAHTLSIESNNVTIEGWTFKGGGNVISIVGRSNVRILNNSFRDHTGGVISLWSSVNGIEIAGNDIVNSRTNKVGIVGGRGSEGSNPCPTVGRNVTIRNNYGDQGAGAIGWFGIELKCFEDVLIEGNRLKGGNVLISLPDSNRVSIRNNTLDLTGSPYMGVEIPKAHNVTIEYNTVFGDGPMNDVAFSANSGSQRMVIRFNKVQNVKTLVEGPLSAIVSDNCIVSVTNISEYGQPEGSTIERNTAC